MAKPRELRFNAFNMAAPSHNWAGLWSHPRDASNNYNSLDYWVDYARTAERGLLDGIFLADVFGVYDVRSRAAQHTVAARQKICVRDDMGDVGVDRGRTEPATAV
jgi:alkanesulfonate monooxygenase SsuD/methylene tetrahydromethanopterin reductase-like flavin-dependent oxidoreductase (luciferase family)